MAPGAWAPAMLGWLMVLPVVSWNPLSAGTGDRLLEVGQEFSKADVIVLTSTCRKNVDPEVPISKKVQAARFVGYQWEWKRSRFCNKSRGITYMIRQALLPHVVRMWDAPAGLHGRVGAPRLKTRGHGYEDST